MNTRQLNHLVGQLEQLFDRFLDGPVWAIICGLALAGYMMGVST